MICYVVSTEELVDFYFLLIISSSSSTRIDYGDAVREFASEAFNTG